MTSTAGLTAVEREYLTRESTLFAYLRINGSAAGRDILALAASGGRLRAADLIRVLEDPARPRRFLEKLAREPLLHLATLFADQGRDVQERVAGRTLLRALAQELGPRAILKEGRFRLLELLLAEEAIDDLEALCAAFWIGRDNIVQPHLYAANATNPFGESRDPEPRRLSAWTRSMNQMFAIDALEPIMIAPGDDAPFDRLASGAAGIVTDGPLVTVVVPTYNPGRRLATAVESLLAQSYRALQIVIVDDASPHAAATALDRWNERDPRIQVVHLAENNGPYLARNIAVSRHAAGDYVTIHDDDDWSHPRKIEMQVAQLEADPALVANMSNSVRASDDLVLGRINGNPVWTQHALSSLMVRRTVFDDIGYWDVLNRSADAEFNDRIRSWTGAQIPVAGRVPTTFYRIRWASLSAGEFRRGYMDARRRWYFQSYLHWHESERARGALPYVPVDDRQTRPFSAPVDLLGSRQRGTERVLPVDLLIVGDFRLHGVAVETTCDEIERVLGENQQVAILQLDSPVIAADARIHPRVLEAARCTNAHAVSLRDAVEARTTVVIDPTSMQFLDAARAPISTERLVLLNRHKHSPSSGGRLYDQQDVADRCRAVFGRAPDSSAEPRDYFANGG